MSQILNLTELFTLFLSTDIYHDSLDSSGHGSPHLHVHIGGIRPNQFGLQVRPFGHTLVQT